MEQSPRPSAASRLSCFFLSSPCVNLPFEEFCGVAKVGPPSQACAPRMPEVIFSQPVVAKRQEPGGRRSCKKLGGAGEEIFLATKSGRGRSLSSAPPSEAGPQGLVIAKTAQGPLFCPGRGTIMCGAKGYRCPCGPVPEPVIFPWGGRSVITAEGHLGNRVTSSAYGNVGVAGKFTPNCSQSGTWIDEARLWVSVCPRGMEWSLPAY